MVKNIESEAQSPLRVLEKKKKKKGGVGQMWLARNAKSADDHTS